MSLSLLSTTLFSCQWELSRRDGHRFAEPLMPVVHYRHVTEARFLRWPWLKQAFHTFLNDQCNGIGQTMNWWHGSPCWLRGSVGRHRHVSFSSRCISMWSSSRSKEVFTLFPKILWLRQYFKTLNVVVELIISNNINTWINEEDMCVRVCSIPFDFLRRACECV